MPGVLGVMLASGGGSFDVELAPSAQYEGGTDFTHTFNPVVATVTGGAGTITYLWSFDYEEIGGTWTIASGQGTASCTVEVGVPREFSSSAILRCTVTRGGVSKFATAELGYSQIGE